MSDKFDIRDIVVLLPGILGSVLGRDGSDVWAISPQAVLTAIMTGGNSIQGLGFRRTSDGHGIAPDGLTATRLFRDTHIIPHFWKIDGYGKIDEVLRKHINLTPENYFDFPYDWRLDNRLAAGQLQTAVATWLEQRRSKLGKDVKLILIAHSMGGLVARYFIEKLEGWKDTRMLITFGTPYYGAVQALGFLVNGYPVNLGPVEIFDFSTQIRSFPSVYQLLPTYKAVRMADGNDLVKIRDVVDRIPNSEADEIRDAIEFHDQIASSVTAHLKLADYLNPRYKIRPVVGTEQPTQVWAIVGDDHAEAQFSYPGVQWTGDSTVPWISAHPGDDPGGDLEQAVYRPERHGSLQNSDDVLLQVRNLIAALVNIPGITHAVAAYGITLHLEDLNLGGSVEVVAESEVGPLHADIVDVETNAAAADRTPLVLIGNAYRGTITGLASGTYRVTVASTSPAVSPVTDVCMVYGTSQ
jgi:pimeloyl-ACP methyl ester carboxylesterase